MLLAVLDRRGQVAMHAFDIYAATVGGVSVRNPAADLAVAVALASAASDRVVPSGTVCFGEVGLAGELRRVPDIEHRLSEAARLGFTSAVIPADVRTPPRAVPTVNGIAVVQCLDLRTALTALHVVGAAPGGQPPRELLVV
jgi:DNA repair protein RadA/Sms